jgi:hypothetical protein
VITAILLATALAAPTARADTIVDMRRGDHVVIANLSGELIVEGWDRDALEIFAEDGDARLRVTRSGPAVRVGPDGGRRRRSSDARIRIPAWADLEIEGVSLDITIRGVGGALSVGNVSGDIVIRDIGGRVEARSIDGEIHVEDARAGVHASSQSDDVVLRRVTGPVEVHSGDGDVLLDDVTSESVRAETQDGDIVFSGSIADGGDYGFFLHDGDAMIAVPASSSARVSVSTFDGEFESEFPVVVQRFTGGREFEFVLGDGGARLQIEAFDGEIRLLRRR